MSTTVLDPTVANKLQQFGRRRSRLLLVRGLCAALVTFLLCICVVALIDWYWVLSDRSRWCLSGAAYLVTAGVVWAVSLRKLIYAPGKEELATHVEDAEPELRENLLSAIELATDNPAAVNDSPVFRALLQGKVALQMARLQVPQLLPVTLLSRWLVAAFVLLAIVILLLSVPDSRFRTLAARAALPGANIERVSRIHVEILQPTPHSTTIAKDESIAVVVDISGGDVDEVVLETFTAAESKRQTMRARTDSEFAANVLVQADTVEYRILAGDAVTKRYTIVGKGRPQVTAFHKSFHYPEYSGLADQSSTDQNGDIIVLQGTEASLLLDVDQPVSAAELRLDSPQSEQMLVIPLTENSTGQWGGPVPVDEAAIYKVHLVSKETGFENIFSPRYEIRPVPDMIPRSGFVDQAETSLLLPPNDILALKGMAEDDLPLVSLQQEVSVNGQEWLSVPLEVAAHAGEVSDTSFSPADAEFAMNSDSDPVHRMTSAWNWDLLGLKLKTGDQVTTRLVAVDRKGNRGESVPLRIVVSAPDFDPDRHAAMHKKAAMYEAYAKFATIAEEHKTAAVQIIDILAKESELPLSEQRAQQQRALDATTLKDLADKVYEAASTVFDATLEVTKSMPAGADAYDLDLAGQVIARIQHDYCQVPHALLTASQYTTDFKRSKQYLSDVKRAFERMHDDAKSAAYHYQYLSAHNVLAGVAADFDALLRQQQLVAESSTQNWSRLLRHETVVLRQMEVAENVMHRHRNSLPDHIRNSLTQQIDWLALRRDQLRQVMESEDQLPQLQQLVQNLYRELKDRQRIDVLDGGLSERLNQARRDFSNRAGTLSEPLWRIADAAQEECRCLVEATNTKDSLKTEESTQEARRYAAEVDLQLRPALEQLRSRRGLTQARRDTDAQFAADAGLTHRASMAVLNQHRVDAPEKNTARDAFREISAAYRILEAGHDMQNAQIALSNLIQLERWGSQGLQARLDHPRQWDVVQKGMEEAMNALRRASVSQEVLSKLDEQRWSHAAREAGRKITQRRWVRDTLIGAGADLVELRDGILAANVQLEAVMADARAVIAKYAPTVSEMAEQIAKNVRELEEDTTALADATSSAEQPTASDATETPAEDAALESQMQQLKKQQANINQQLDDLFEALVEDANSQDLLDEDQRERARDADDSIAMVQEPAQEMNRALQQAEAITAADQQAKQLSVTAEQQEKTAQALDKIAQHFEALDNNQDVAESRAELRQFEREQGIARQMDQQFEDVSELAEMAQLDQKTLLEQLEAELQRNPAMQTALSEISQNTVEEAQSALQDAAAREQEIQRSNERSDTAFQAKKKELVQDLKKIAEQASKLGNELVEQSRSAASQSKTPEATTQFAEARQKLNEAAQLAGSASDSELQADLAEKLKQTQQALQEATEQLKSGQQQSADAKDTEIYSDDKSRENAKKNLDNQRKRFNDQRKKNADSIVRRLQDDERRKAADVKNAESSVKAEDNRVQAAKRNLAKTPDDSRLQQAVDAAEKKKQQAESKAADTRQEQQAARQRTEAAKQQRNDLDSVPEPELNDKNPAAQLAESFASEAIDDAAKLNDQVQQLVQNADFGSELNPEKNQLANSVSEQANVKADVSETAEDLARAARHEQRLDNSPAAQQLKQAADDVEKVANNEATQAVNQLDMAATAAAESGKGDTPARSNNQQALDANQAVATSESAIANQADALAAALAPSPPGESANEASPTGEPQTSDGSQQTASAQPSAGGQPESAAASQQPAATPQEIAQGQQLAQVLDELDRQQANAAAAQLQSLAQAARAKQAQLSAARAQSQQQSAFAQNPAGKPSEGIPAYDGQTDAFAVVPLDRTENNDWGKLRQQDAEDLTKGRKERVSEEYRKSVEAYFKVLAERARKNK